MQVSTVIIISGSNLLNTNTNEKHPTTKQTAASSERVIDIIATLKLK